MKKVLIFGLVLILMVALAACANPQDMMEKMIEQAAKENGENVDVDIDNDGSMSIKGEDGEVKIQADEDSVNISSEDGEINMQGGEAMEWPTDKLPANVPHIPGVNVVMVMDAGEGVNIGFENCDKATAEAYVQTLESMGWENLGTTTLPEGFAAIFQSGDEMVQINWSKDENAGSLLYGVR